jgi:hypothetical protein
MGIVKLSVRKPGSVDTLTLPVAVSVALETKRELERQGYLVAKESRVVACYPTVETATELVASFFG